MSFRKEKKFKLSYSDAALMQKNLIRRGMLELHPLRKVNSCYFDNEMMTLFLDSEEARSLLDPTEASTTKSPRERSTQ